MAGILDSKQRVMDVIITNEGRAQAAAGELSIKYATFTDRHTFYDTDTIKSAAPVANDASGRIFFECASRQQDQIVIETLDGGTVKPFRAGDFDLTEGNFIAGLSPEGVRTGEPFVYTGSDFVSNANTILQEITNNFYDQQILGTTDPFSDTTDFVLSDTSLTFEISDTRPFDFRGVRPVTEMKLENIESIFQDRKFSHLTNFMYLPPVNRPRLGQAKGDSLGTYVNWNQKPPVTLQELMSNLDLKESREIEFTDTSRENNLLIQPFEFSDMGVKKLCIIDYGEFPDEDPYSPGKRVFFVGKLYKDRFETSTFVNIFTIIMD